MKGKACTVLIARRVEALPHNFYDPVEAKRFKEERKIKKVAMSEHSNLYVQSLEPVLRV